MTGIAHRGTIGGREVGRVGLGVMGAAEHSHRDGTQSKAVEFLRSAADLGVDHFDTATFYTGANALLRGALGSRLDEVLVATKIGAERTPDGGLEPRQKPDELRASVELNLSTLGVDRLGLVYLRRADHAPGIVSTGDQIVPLETQLETLAALRDEGLIESIGLSAVSADQLAGAMATGVGIAAIQNMYAVTERAQEATLQAAAAHGIAWVPFFPLGSGFPGRQKVADHPVVVEIAAEVAATPAQVGLAWLLVHDPTLFLIAGTGSIEHLRENLAAVEVELGVEQVARLDAIAG